MNQQLLGQTFDDGQILNSLAIINFHTRIVLQYKWPASHGNVHAWNVIRISSIKTDISEEYCEQKLD